MLLLRLINGDFMVSLSSRNFVIKSLCLGFAVTNLLAIVTSYFRYSFIDEKFHTLLQYDYMGYLLPLSFMWPIFGLSMVLSFAPLPYIYKGNFLAWKIFIFGALFSLALSFFSGVRVSSPVESFFGGLLYFLWGGIVFIGVFDFIDNNQPKELPLDAKQ